MFYMPKIGIIGFGFVGKAIADSYLGYNLVIIDTDPSKNCATSYKELFECEGIFICVPSPNDEQGNCNTSILKSVLDNLKGYTGVIISKVTAPPAAYEELGSQYPNLVHVPEFLTAANASRDYAKQQWSIIGGSILAYQREAERIIKYSKSEITVFLCAIGEASLVKYIINSFLATKVVFMNEMAELSSKHEYDWSIIRNLISLDDRIGKSHLQVPGPDGYYGFGGFCFPKDTQAILSYADNIGVTLNVLKEAVKKNTLMRLQKPK